MKKKSNSNAVNTGKLPKFVAIVIFKSESDNPNYIPLYEETISLVDAQTLDEAEKKVQMYAKSYQTSFQNKEGQTISWKAHKIVDVNQVLADEVETNEPVTELYSRHFRNYEAYQTFETLISKESL
jgi:Domain of unknown function (DUF4288)